MSSIIDIEEEIGLQNNLFKAIDCRVTFANNKTWINGELEKVSLSTV